MNDEKLANDILKHYGVMGMKWGVTRSKAELGNSRAIKKLSRADASWEKEINTTKGFIKINNAMADRLNGPSGAIAKFNDEHADPSVDYTKPSPEREKYHAEFQKVSEKAFKEALNAVYGESPSGKKTTSVQLSSETNEPYITIEDVDVKHEDSARLVIRLRTNNKGHILSAKKLKQGEISHSDLKHYGILGMRWGVRKGPEGRVTVSKKAKARKTRRANSQDYDTSRTLNKTPNKTLSNQDIESINKRFQLEKKNHDLTKGTTTIGKGALIAGGLIATAAVANNLYSIAKSPVVRDGAKMVARLLIKK